MEVRFILDKPNGGKPTHIFLKSHLQGKPFKYSICEKILPEHWSFENQKPKDSKSHKTLIKTISDIESIIHRFVESHKIARRTFTSVEIRKELDEYFNKRSTPDKKVDSFHALIDQFRADCASGKKLTKKGKRYSAETIRGYKHCQDKFKEYERAKKLKLSFSSITMDIVNDMIHFYNSQDLSMNSIGKIIKNFKVFTKELSSNSIHSEIKPPAEETPDIYLTEKDLDALQEVELSDRNLQIVRDRFLVDCFLGLRISDLQLITSNNIQGNFISIANEKTDGKVVIPIHPRVKKVFEKYSGMPPKVSDQEMNRSIKKVALKAKLNEKFLYTVTKGGVRKDFYLPKWEMVSNHTARRTFITNLLKAGISSSVVMKLAGIKKAQTLERYNKISEEENAELVAKHPFFLG